MESNIRNRYIGTCYNDEESPQFSEVDLSTFVLRLLLFDCYIFESNRLTEFKSLIKAFGYGGVKQLLTSKALKVHCEMLTVAYGQTGLGCSIKKDGSPKGILPLNSYKFDVLIHGEKYKIMHGNLQKIHAIEDLKHKEAINLKRLIADNLMWLPEDSNKKILAQLLYDFKIKTPNIKKAISLCVAEKLAIQNVRDDFSFNIEVDEEDDVHVNSNLMKIFGLDARTVHELTGKALMAIGGLNKRIEMMRFFSALTGLRENELNIFEDKIDFLIKRISPEYAEERLRKVVSWPQFPDLNEAVCNKKINVETLLKIRETAECKEFREWLWNSDSLSVDELNERFKSLYSKLSIMTSSMPGKIIRWLVTTGVGIIPEYGTVAGTALGFLDSFLIDRLLKSSGVLTFLGRFYPTIFKGM